MKFEYKVSNIIRGGVIYTTGDTLAAIISNAFLWERMLGILLIGCTVYAFEIPNYFKWIDQKVGAVNGIQDAMKRTALAILYFNPIWIARHILFLKLFSAQYDQIDWNLLEIGLISFAVNIPISIAANYLIQNKVNLEWRFLASALFSALMALYYALSAIWFQ
ncbi:MAG: hypothetical protein ACPGJS_13215 [Flammeovirgaceae bacterium]